MPSSVHPDPCTYLYFDRDAGSYLHTALESLYQVKLLSALRSGESFLTNG